MSVRVCECVCIYERAAAAWCQLTDRLTQRCWCLDLHQEQYLDMNQRPPLCVFMPELVPPTFEMIKSVSSGE